MIWSLVLVALILYALFIIIRLFLGLCGFTRDQNGRIRHSIATMLAHIVVLGGAYELFSWAATRWGGAYVLGVLVGGYVLLVLPLKVLILAIPRSNHR